MLNPSVGDTVYLDESQTTGGIRFPGPWQVVKLNPKTVKLAQNGRTVNADRSLLLTAPLNGGAEIVDIPDHFVLGQIVRYTGDHDKRLVNRDLVVLKDLGLKARVTLLGGYDDRYWIIGKTRLEAQS